MITIILHWQWHFIRFLWTVFLFFLLLLFQRYHNGLWSLIDMIAVVMYIVGPWCKACILFVLIHIVWVGERRRLTRIISRYAFLLSMRTNFLLYYPDVVRRVYKLWRGCYKPAHIPRRGIPSRSTSGLFLFPVRVNWFARRLTGLRDDQKRFRFSFILQRNRTLAAPFWKLRLLGRWRCIVNSLLSNKLSPFADSYTRMAVRFLRTGSSFTNEVHVEFVRRTQSRVQSRTRFGWTIGLVIISTMRHTHRV